MGRIPICCDDGVRQGDGGPRAIGKIINIKIDYLHKPYFLLLSLLSFPGPHVNPGKYY
jgi:hypothetical protein